MCWIQVVVVQSHVAIGGILPKQDMPVLMMFVSFCSACRSNLEAIAMVTR